MPYCYQAVGCCPGFKLGGKPDLFEGLVEGSIPLSGRLCLSPALVLVRLGRQNKNVSFCGTREGAIFGQPRTGLRFGRSFKVAGSSFYEQRWRFYDQAIWGSNVRETPMAPPVLPVYSKAFREDFFKLQIFDLPGAPINETTATGTHTQCYGLG